MFALKLPARTLLHLRNIKQLMITNGDRFVGRLNFSRHSFNRDSNRCRTSFSMTIDDQKILQNKTKRAQRGALIFFFSLTKRIRPYRIDLKDFPPENGKPKNTLCSRKCCNVSLLFRFFLSFARPFISPSATRGCTCMLRAHFESTPFPPRKPFRRPLSRAFRAFGQKSRMSRLTAGMFGVPLDL